MPKFIEIGDYLFNTECINKITPDSVSISMVNGKEDFQYFIRVSHSKGEDLVYFKDEQSCITEYQKVRDILIHNPQKLNS